jgi:hypothetical protein
LAKSYDHVHIADTVAYMADLHSVRSVELGFEIG